MNYEIVNLEEKTVAGFSARTNNTSPDMGKVIGGLWQKLYSPDGCFTLKNRTNEKALGIYTDYADDEKADYTVVTACEVSGEDVPDNFELRKIPAGKYAKFVVKGHMVAAVQQFWTELWKMNLERSFVCDFEEYQNADTENAEIHIYIGLKRVRVMGNFDEKLPALWKKIGTHGIMALSTCSENRVTSRPMSMVVIDGRFYCQTDQTYLKYRQISENPNVAVCHKNFSIEGTCKCIGKPLENNFFIDAFKKYFYGSYKAYSDLQNELLLEIVPTLIYSWNYKLTKPYMEYFDFVNFIFHREEK